MTTEQIEQKKQQLKQLAEEVKQLKDDLVEAGAIELSEDELNHIAGGSTADENWRKMVLEFAEMP
jgi:bacteriocin-like protein